MNLQDAVLAGRYAKALFLAARQAKAQDAVQKDLKALSKALRSDPGLAASLAHPRLSLAEKKSGLAKALGGKPHALTDRFIGLLLSRKRLALLSSIAGLFDAQADEAQGVVRAQVRSAAALTEGQSKSLAAGLKKALGGAEAAFDVTIDPSLLGGVIVRAGDRLWDLSLQGRLRALREKLLETAVN
jgi:F-type H+-transporting ATPase subunit delta